MEKNKNKYGRIKKDGTIDFYSVIDGGSYTLDENGLLHSYDDNACYMSTGVGKISYMEWCRHGITHRIEGPSVIWYNYDEVFEEGYYINGILLSKGEWEIEVNRIKMIEEI